MLSSTRDRSASLTMPWLRLLAIPNVRRLAEARFLANVYFYSAVIVRFESSRGLDYTQMFLLESVLSLTIWLLDIPTGIWADRIGYRTLLIVSHALNAASLVVMLLAHGFPVFAFGAVLFGAGVACASGCESALVMRSLAASDVGDGARHSASAFALLGACSSAGFLVGLMTGTLFGAHDPTLAVAATLVPATLAVVAVCLLRPVSPDLAAGKAAPAIGPRRALALAWRLMVRQPALIGLSLTGSASFVCVNAIFWYNQPLLERAGVAASWFGPLTAIAVGCAVVVPLTLRLARRYVSRRVSFAVSLLAPGLGYLALARVGSAWAVVALLALVVGGAAWREPLLSEALNERIDDAARATTLSALSFVGALAGVAANALVGRAGDAGLTVVGYALGATLLALGCLAPWLMPRERAD